MLEVQINRSVIMVGLNKPCHEVERAELSGLCLVLAVVRDLPLGTSDMPHRPKLTQQIQVFEHCQCTTFGIMIGLFGSH